MADITIAPYGTLSNIQMDITNFTARNPQSFTVTLPTAGVSSYLNTDAGILYVKDGTGKVVLEINDVQAQTFTVNAGALATSASDLLDKILGGMP